MSQALKTCNDLKDCKCVCFGYEKERNFKKNTIRVQKGLVNPNRVINSIINIPLELFTLIRLVLNIKEETFRLSPIMSYEPHEMKRWFPQRGRHDRGLDAF